MSGDGSWVIYEDNKLLNKGKTLENNKAREKGGDKMKLDLTDQLKTETGQHDPKLGVKSNL